MLGWPPVSYGYLDAEDGAERIVADLVLERAEELRVQRERQFWTNQAISVQNGVAKAFKKAK